MWPHPGLSDQLGRGQFAGAAHDQLGRHHDGLRRPPLTRDPAEQQLGGAATAGYELNAIAACVIGGASLFGARGGAFGAAAGALIVATLNNGGNLLAINSFYLQIIIGLLILVAVLFDQWQGRISARAAR
jgi:hypothetical protein